MGSKVSKRPKTSDEGYMHRTVPHCATPTELKMEGVPREGFLGNGEG